MPIFICQRCQTLDNSALGEYWGKEEKLCSECGRGRWHGAFPKEKYDPKKWEKDGDFVKLK
jgi:hypothetical protein